MEETPELIQMLKYILFGMILLVSESPGHSQPLPHPGSRLDPLHPTAPEELFPNFPFQSKLMGNDLEEGGEDKPHPQMMPHSQRGQGQPPGGILDKFGGSLCSIFKSFLEGRRFQRCRISRKGGSGYRRPHPMEDGRMNMRPPNNMEGMMDMMMPRPVPMMHMHNMHTQPLKDYKRFEGDRDQTNGRVQHLDDSGINHSGEDFSSMNRRDEGEEEDNSPYLMEDNLQEHPSDHSEGGGDDMMGGMDPTKISQSRTMILVPERACPAGHRRDPRGYCRRLIKIRTAPGGYPNSNSQPLPQYGPPPQGKQSTSSNSLRQIPIRYYYSRIVSLPTLQLYYPNLG